jgi:hypothetical protein
MLRDLAEAGWNFEGEAQAAATDLAQRPGRRGRPDSAYLPIAVRYAQLVEAGDKAPNRTMAAEMGRDRQQIRDLVRRCRERDLLTKGKRGLAEGRLTDKAIELLRQEGKDD